MTHSTLRIIALIALLLSLGVALGGCNTIRGAGQDVEAAGDAIEEEAEEAKTY